jgi:hypothetical protein
VTVCDWDSTTNIAQYARLAKELRELAAQAKCSEAREQMIVLAAQYQHLAEHAATSKNGLECRAVSPIQAHETPDLTAMQTRPG